MPPRIVHVAVYVRAAVVLAGNVYLAGARMQVKRRHGIMVGDLSDPGCQP